MFCNLHDRFVPILFDEEHNDGGGIGNGDHDDIGDVDVDVDLDGQPPFGYGCVSLMQFAVFKHVSHVCNEDVLMGRLGSVVDACCDNQFGRRSVRTTVAAPHVYGSVFNIN